MAGAVVAKDSLGVSGSSTTVAMAFTCSAGERIYVQVTAGTSGTAINSVSDGTNTYVAQGTTVFQTGPTASRVFVCDNAAAVVAGTLTGTYAGSVGTRTIAYVRVSGTDANAPLGSNRAASSTAGANGLSSGNASGTLTQPNFYLGLAITGGSGLSIAAGTSPLSYSDDGTFTTRDTLFGYFSRVEHCSTTSTTNNPATFTLGASDFSIAHVVVVAEASSGSGAWAAAGAGAMPAVGASIAAGAMNAAGAGSATFTGAARAEAVLNAAGAGNMPMVGAAIGAGVLNAAGAATVSWVGSDGTTYALGAWSAAGIGDMQATGASIAAGAMLATGTSVAAFTSDQTVPVVPVVTTDPGPGGGAKDGGFTWSEARRRREEQQRRKRALVIAAVKGIAPAVFAAMTRPGYIHINRTLH